jgi:hypothetical protein
LITPHNAAESAPAAIARYALQQVARERRQQAPAYLVDRAKGY